MKPTPATWGSNRSRARGTDRERVVVGLVIAEAGDPYGTIREAVLWRYAAAVLAMARPIATGPDEPSKRRAGY